MDVKGFGVLSERSNAFVLDKCHIKENNKIKLKFTLSTGYESQEGE
jgi:hypothetical protein